MGGWASGWVGGWVRGLVGGWVGGWMDHDCFVLYGRCVRSFLFVSSVLFVGVCVCVCVCVLDVFGGGGYFVALNGKV